MTEVVRVVAAAIVRDTAGGRQVLACRRTSPPALAGLWEFPGGKVEPGESLTEALLREIDEELRVAIRIDGPLGPPLPMIGGPGLWQPYSARIVAGEPRLVDHDELRWLGPDELDQVPWLATDLPVMAEVERLLRD
ncbi:MAG: NUDIX domain-containing protein [Candidatus Nanopelagicales bacterium]